ncbi:MAG TPA: amidohydrolase family protein [Bryobacteraceae bacterium]|jgi:enamidase|nr:amidohydrolase family protein [Bryobacteraceae bacterium]
MDTFRRFLITSALLLAAPIPFAACLMFRMGGWRTALLSLTGELVLGLVYWWPIGAFLSWYKGRAWTKLVGGYLFSLPLYFVTLAAMYPIWGGASFRPFVNGRWIVYLSATPQFYGMVLLLFYLTTWRTARWTRWGAAFVLAAGTIAPVWLMAATRLNWPGERSHTVITGARIVDAPSARILDGQNVYISEGRIVEIGPESAHADWPRIEAHGRYLLPGLIDVHTHLQSPVEVPAGFQFAYFMKSMIGDYSVQRGQYLAAGVTSVRDLGGPAETNFRLRADILAKKTLGPRFFAVGRLVTSPHGHPVSTIWSADISRQGAILAHDEASLLDGLNRNFAEGPPDAVKIVHGTIGRAKEELSTELMARAIRWADDHKLISIVHAETAAEVEDAIRSGATGVEHTAYLQDVPDSLAALVAQRRPFLDPTFGEFQTSLGLSHVSTGGKARDMQCSYESVRRLYRAGARIAIGTDAPMVSYGSGFHDELAHFARAGFTPAEILTFATLNNAAYLGKADELGRVATGYRADLILTDANPLENLGAMRQPVWTMLDGQIVAGRK